MRRSFSQGMTLVELMVVVAVIAVLAGIALPMYQDYIRRAKRVECEGVMLSVAGTLERSMSANGKYPPATGQGAITLPSCPKDGGTTNYTLAYTSNDQTYTLTATPVGMQVQDTKCGVLTLNHAGQKGAKGTVPNPDCWR